MPLGGHTSKGIFDRKRGAVPKPPRQPGEAREPECARREQSNNFFTNHMNMTDDCTLEPTDGGPAAVC